jgi:NDP-sugar pyrophosphorylase family protein
MALDKNFLKYKLEKIENDKIIKDLSAEDKQQSRKKNAEAAQQHADAIHSYLTGMDPIRIFSNKSFLEPDSMPGNLALTDKGQLNLTQVEPPAAKLTLLMRMLRKHKSFGGANKDKGKKLKILKKVFDSLNIIFKFNKLSMDKDFEVKGSVGVGNNIIIGGNNIVKKNSSVIGNHTIGGGLTVNGKSSTFRGSVNLKSAGTRTPTNLIVDGNIQGTKDLTLGQNLKIEKNGEIGGNLIVNKNEIIKGNVQVNKNQRIKETLRVDKKLTVGKTTDVKGNLITRKTSNTFGFHNVGLGLNVMGLTILGGGVLIAPIPIPPIPGLPRPAKTSADLRVKGDIIGEQDLQITDNSVVEGNSTVEGNLEVHDETVLRGQVSVQDDLEVLGDTTFEGDSKFEGNVSIKESVADVNGYTYLPNGIILQWGTATSNSDDTQNFEFSKVFPNACFNVVTQRRNGDVVDVLPVTSISTTNFQINRNASIDGSHSFYWQALGN